MEKSTPHCKLSVVKTMIQAGRVRTTMSALAGGAALGFDFDEIVGIVMALALKDFHKSMTTPRRPQSLARRVSPHYESRRGLSEAHRHR